MCEEIYGKVVVFLLLLPLVVTAVLAIWYGIDVWAHKVCQSINTKRKEEKPAKQRIPTEQQVKLIKGTTQKMYMYVSKKQILRVILEWEKIRGKR